jgi:hypothetical protein
MANSSDKKIVKMRSSTLLLTLKELWKVDSIYQVGLILLTFTLTGTTVLLLKKWLFIAVGYTEQTPILLKIITYVFFIFSPYQILILMYGFLLGPGKFFWEKERKMLRFLKKNLFVRK